MAKPKENGNARRLATAARQGDNLPLRDAARRLGINHDTLRDWAVYKRRLPYLRLGGKKIVFRPADLAAFEAACLVPARPADR